MKKKGGRLSQLRLQDNTILKESMGFRNLNDEYPSWRCTLCLNPCLGSVPSKVKLMQIYFWEYFFCWETSRISCEGILCGTCPHTRLIH